MSGVWRPSRPARWMLIAGLSVAGLVILLAAPALPPVRHAAERRLSRTTGFDWRIGSLRVLTTSGPVMRDVRLAPRSADAAQPAVVAIGRVHGDFDWRSLGRARLRWREVVLRDLSVIISPAERAPLAEPAPPDEPPGAIDPAAAASLAAVAPSIAEATPSTAAPSGVGLLSATALADAQSDASAGGAANITEAPSPQELSPVESAPATGAVASAAPGDAPRNAAEGGGRSPIDSLRVEGASLAIETGRGTVDWAWVQRVRVVWFGSAAAGEGSITILGLASDCFRCDEPINGRIEARGEKWAASIPDQPFLGGRLRAVAMIDRLAPALPWTGGIHVAGAAMSEITGPLAAQTKRLGGQLDLRATARGALRGGTALRGIARVTATGMTATVDDWRPAAAATGGDDQHPKPVELPIRDAAANLVVAGGRLIVHDASLAADNVMVRIRGDALLRGDVSLACRIYLTARGAEWAREQSAGWPPERKIEWTGLEGTPWSYLDFLIGGRVSAPRILIWNSQWAPTQLADEIHRLTRRRP